MFVNDVCAAIGTPLVSWHACVIDRKAAEIEGVREVGEIGGEAGMG